MVQPRRTHPCLTERLLMGRKESNQTKKNRLVTDGNTKICCRGFILALFQSTTANKIDSEHTRDCKKLFFICKVEILQVTVN